MLTSDTVEEKPPQRGKEKDETEGILQEKLGPKRPIKKPGIRRMTEPAKKSFVRKIAEET